MAEHTASDMRWTEPQRVGRGVRRWWTPIRIGSVVLGAAALVIAAGLLLVGAVTLQQDTANGVDLGAGEYAGDAYAISSAPLDWSAENYLGGPIEQVRFDVSAADDATGVFMALTTPEMAAEYLTGETRSVDDGHRFEYSEHSGEAPAVSPGDLDIWTAQAEADKEDGEARLEFSPQEQAGERVLVVMDADGRPLEQVDVASYGGVPAVRPIGIALLAGGVALGAGGIVLIAVPVRRVLAERRRGVS